LFEHPVFARPYTRVVDRRSYGRKSKPEKFAYGRRSTGHSVLKSESIHDPEFLGRKHDLQPLLSDKTLCAVDVLHGQ